MSDPTRLLDTEQPELLEAWRSARAPATARARALALAGVGATAVVATSTATTATTIVAAKVSAGAAAPLSVAPLATAGAATSGLFTLKVVAAIGLAATVGGGSVLGVRALSSSASDPAVTTIAPVKTVQGPNEGAPPSGRESEGPRVEGAAPLVSSVPVVAVSALPSARPVERAPAAASHIASGRPVTEVRSPPSSSMPGGLAVELAKIDHARAALTAGDPVTALRELDAFERAHPGSSLTEDAWVVRFDALVAKGERAEAREVARTFVRRWPSSPYVTRIRRTIDGEP